MKKTAYIILIALAGCYTNSESEDVQPMVRLNKHDFSDYLPKLDLYTRKAKVYSSFRTDFLLSVTYLNQQFREALNAKIFKIHSDNYHQLLSEPEKTAFFVSYYTDDKGLDELDDSDLWSVWLQGHNAETKSSPEKIIRLNKKDRWQNYFPYITTWSQEYLVVFDQNTHSGKPVMIHFSNSEASASLSF